MKRCLILCLLSLLVVGCKSSGSSSTGPGIEKFTIIEGKTTEQELIAQFGEPDPNRITDMGRGKRMMMWSDSTRKMQGLILTLGLGPGDMHTLHVTLENGVVERYTTTGKDTLEALAIRK